MEKKRMRFSEILEVERKKRVRRNLMLLTVIMVVILLSIIIPFYQNGPDENKVGRSNRIIEENRSYPERQSGAHVKEYLKDRYGLKVESPGKPYTVTAYCACHKCCGIWALNRTGPVVGSAGIELIPQKSVAANLPIGTKIEIDGSEYIVHDRPADWIIEKYQGRIIDVYFASHAEAEQFGKQIKFVKII